MINFIFRQSTRVVQLSHSLNLSSIEKEAIDNYNRDFKSKEFMSHHTQGMSVFVMHNAYKKEEESFTKTLRKVHATKVPVGDNVMPNHDCT